MLLADASQKASLDLASNPIGHDFDPSTKPGGSIGPLVGTRNLAGEFLDDLFSSPVYAAFSPQQGFPILYASNRGMHLF
jgi:hypothetical protein